MQQNRDLRPQIKELRPIQGDQQVESISSTEGALRRIVNSMPVHVWSASPDGMIDFFNEKWLEYTGMSAEDAFGTGWAVILHPDDALVTLETWKELISSGRDESDELEIRLRRRDGEYRWFLVRARAVRDCTTGEITNWYGSNIDIHDRKLAEDVVRRSETALATAQRVGRVGSFSWCVGSAELQGSYELYQILDFDQKSPLTFERLLQRIHPDSRQQVHSLMDQTNFENDYENRLVMDDGSEKIVILKIDQTTHPDGSLEYFGAIADVTERRQNEDALAQARADLAVAARAASMGVMAAAIAHEVSQPLLGILTNAELSVRMLGKDPSKVSEAIETGRRIIRDANRASDVISRLRNLFGNHQVSLGVVDLNDAVNEVVELSRFELRRERIELSQDLEPAPFVVLGDRVQLQQVVLNLLRNAMDALKSTEPNRRQICVRTFQSVDGLNFSIEDTGGGFSDRDASRLFDSFFTTKLNGMGVGLSMSRTIIEAHNGALWGRNNDKGGATFGFSLPVPASV
jgi:PAS domain S-box-containing protein